MRCRDNPTWHPAVRLAVEFPSHSSDSVKLADREPAENPCLLFREPTVRAYGRSVIGSYSVRSKRHPVAWETDRKQAPADHIRSQKPTRLPVARHLHLPLRPRSRHVQQ